MLRFRYYAQLFVLRLRRQRLCLRNLRIGRGLTQVRPPARSHGIFLFCTIRNEKFRLPEFLAHYRALGVEQFFFVDNGSTDGTAEYLSEQADAAVWYTTSSYRGARYGMDWLGALKWRYGHDQWCLTVDADELLVYPDYGTRPLAALTDWLDSHDRRSFGALLLDMYAGPDDDWDEGEARTLDMAPWFDRANYRAQPDTLYGHDWVQGGPRERAFFARNPHRSPALNKIPLVRWKRGFAYVSSTHHLLPRGLNRRLEYLPTGVLLHTKFLPGFAATAAREVCRREHYGHGLEYRAYLARAIGRGGLHHAGSTRLSGVRQLEALGLMSRGAWV